MRDRDEALLRLALDGSGNNASGEQARVAASENVLHPARVPLFDEWAEIFQQMHAGMNLREDTQFLISHPVHSTVFERAESGDDTAREALTLWLLGSGLAPDLNAREIAMHQIRFMLWSRRDDQSLAFDLLSVATEYWSQRPGRTQGTLPTDPLVAALVACDRDHDQLEPLQAALDACPSNWTAVRLDLQTRIAEFYERDLQVAVAHRALNDPQYTAYCEDAKKCSIGRLLWQRRALVEGWLHLRDGNYQRCQDIIRQIGSELLMAPHSFIARRNELGGRERLGHGLVERATELLEAAEAAYRSLGWNDDLAEMWTIYAMADNVVSPPDRLRASSGSTT